MFRRTLLKLAVTAATAVAMDRVLANAPVRIGLTPVFLDDQLDFLKRLRVWFESQLGQPVLFVQRGSYREIVDLVRMGKIDFAWLCGFPFVRNQSEMRLLAVPLYRGHPLYRSYLIVPARDTQTQSILDLEGKIFAYSDPDSNSGFLYPQFTLLKAGKHPEGFFSRTFFTWGHRKVVEAVAVGLAQGGAVDGYVWDTLARAHPELTRETRIASQSPELGYPPFVARHDIREADFRRMQNALLTMKDNPSGAELLKTLNLDGFIAGDPRLFAGIAKMAKTLQVRGK